VAVVGRLLAVVVEDDSAMRMLVMEIIRSQLDAEVMGAGDGEHALRLIGSIRPGLVVLDVDLPLVHGLDVARRLRADPAFAALPILAMSGWEADAETRAAGCDGFIKKPFRADALVEAVRKLLDQGV
jgi:DNA-binding response OmpR family regulator